jgi:hypothetical protein
LNDELVLINSFKLDLEKGNIPFGKIRRREEENIKIDGNEPSSRITHWKILDWLHEN